MCGLSPLFSPHRRAAAFALTVLWTAFQQHPALTSLNIERINLGERGARGLSTAVIRGLPLEGVSAYGLVGMMGAFLTVYRFRSVHECLCW